MARKKIPTELKKTAVIQLKVREEYKEQVEKTAELKGFASVTAYIEHLIDTDK